MTENVVDRENEAVDQVVSWLRERFPSSWTVERSNRADVQALDGAIDLRANNGISTTMLVEAKRTFTPRDADKLLDGMTRSYRAMNPHVPILAVADWISPQAQERLRSEGIGYVDLTGNAWLSLENPAVFISAQGSTKNPNPIQPGKVRIQGPKAGRLIRWLADVRPPYGVREFAAATSLSQSYVSRIFEALDEEALVERSKRGAIESVDVGRLLRRWTETYSLLRANDSKTYIAPRGAPDALERMRELPHLAAVTGSYAAVRRAPVAAPALLAVYAQRPSELANDLGLLPADSGANVVILTPFDPVVWLRPTIEDGLTYVADSQAAADCLTGTGRMPAEGQALLDWMIDNETEWRQPRLTTEPSS